MPNDSNENSSAGSSNSPLTSEDVSKPTTSPAMSPDPVFPSALNQGIDSPPSPQMKESETTPEIPSTAPVEIKTEVPQSNEDVAAVNPPVHGQPTETEPPSPVAVTTGGRQSKFGFFALLGLIIAIFVWGGVTYLYLENQKLKKEETGTPDVNISQSPTTIPTPTFSPDQIQIKNGSVVLAVPNSEVKILVDKADYKTTSITGFAKVLVSPDNALMCFEAWPPAPAPALYYSTIKGENVIKIGENYKNCTWSPDSKSIFYLNTANLDSPVNIYSYNTNVGKETNITLSSQTTGEKAYEIVGLSADAASLICKYVDLTSVTSPKEEVNCEIDLKTLKVEDTPTQSSQ
ncbi:hypothetical protein A2962_04855 [Candidatus Woesebacteria bacterium RIFCSPLOWO2_01_FULL_39_61]|uniref:Dipeptidylpeptidase IV N-terminal domain-containing protein n=1 Tax=Candidatus Woesebacteria bacterium RIFCSPHIGHO2_02_FULL_39_13 TaxID=1802505 RepID=A0A1F7Z645_9BACT|nr:MAG: hypothetical protein A2692_00820 [Candidatus Woesebacteria bacterium RIFCSPHIGHO2_01_FULL_39_95]OGM34245.1 MAG: hypothetical protein A3D01_01845 [Candidatus Woesebacteria bacterium RIFCSPHIGHO2_02_FULL_39_13]OGM38590.1 MAG: hypothetical protein A3E13_00365 [Candidatus Woesebacteria bacterium RIFCSPHIGHO2_12_FULL_40_20]OGM67075.1 MAG: hypothetical protein A2962_04855 [Candidatus Woesebacteria bacterium RIFCSPLOWO2_01_FULL_39_61]OGM71720.1 MAG: hypothetical protein A3H19_03455 [Candidatus